MTDERAKRPALVWIISIFFFLSAGYSLWSIVAVGSGAIPGNAQQQAYFSSLSAFDYITSIGIGVLNLAGAISLFLLHKKAPWFFLGALILGLTSAAYQAVAKNWLAAIGTPGLVGFILFQVILVSIVLYAFRLRARGVLQ